MSAAHRIELLHVAPNDYTVIVWPEGLFADRLCRDEALGLIAAFIYCSPVIPPYLRSYEQWYRWQMRYSPTPPEFPAGRLISWNGKQPTTTH